MTIRDAREHAEPDGELEQAIRRTIEEDYRRSQQ
jgi:hypothetical protein